MIRKGYFLSRVFLISLKKDIHINLLSLSFKNVNVLPCLNYTVAQNKPDSTKQEIVSCCESNFKKIFYKI